MTSKHSSARVIISLSGCLIGCLFLSSCVTTAPNQAAAEPVSAVAHDEDSAAEIAIEGETRPPLERTEPTSASLMHRVFAAELMGKEGDLQAAASEYLEAAMESNDPEVAERAAQVAIAAQSWQQAAMAADRWALLAPENISAHETAAVALLRLGDYTGAELQMDHLLELMDDRAKAWSLIATLLGQTPHPEKASKVLQSLLSRHGDQENADALHAQSQFAARSGNRDRALGLAELAIAVEPERIEFVIWAGRLALSLEKPDQALDYFGRASALSPDDHDLALAYADLLARNGQEDTARATMAGMKQVPDVMLSRILFEISAEEPGTAEELFQEFSRMEFSDPNQAAFFQAQAAEALGKTDEAISYYGSVDSGAYALDAAIRRAEMLASEGHLDQARQELDDLRHDGDRAAMEQSWLTESQLLRGSGELSEARSLLGDALEQFPQSVALLYSRALMAAEQSDVHSTEVDLRIVLELEPDNAAALNALGYTLADQTERFDEARRLIESAYALQPDQASIIDSMGWIAFRQGRLQESARYLHRAWRLDNNPEIAAHLGEVLWVTGDQEAAMEAWRAGAEVDAANSVLQATLDRLGVHL